MKLSIVLPCLNEARTVSACVWEATHAVEASGLEGEVLVVDNGSTDSSVPLALAAGARVVHAASRGYGAALHTGVLAARGEWVVVADSDGSYDLSQTPALLSQLEKGMDLVVGNRFSGGIFPGAMPWKNRWIGNPALSALGRWVSGAGVGDFLSGFRAFRRSRYLSLGMRGAGMEWGPEMIVRGQLTGLRMDEVPIHLRPDGRGRPPHLRPWRDGLRTLWILLRLSSLGRAAVGPDLPGAGKLGAEPA